jgi:hypothetical protein
MLSGHSIEKKTAFLSFKHLAEVFIKNNKQTKMLKKHLVDILLNEEFICPQIAAGTSLRLVLYLTHVRELACSVTGV